MIRELGSSENLLCDCNGKKYFVELEYILPIGCELVESPTDPVSLTSFFLKIHLPDRTLLFEDCVYESVQTSCEVGKSLICTMPSLSQTSRKACAYSISAMSRLKPPKKVHGLSPTRAQKAGHLIAKAFFSVKTAINPAKLWPRSFPTENQSRCHIRYGAMQRCF